MNIIETESPITISRSAYLADDVISALIDANIRLSSLEDHFLDLVANDDDLNSCNLDRVWKLDNHVIIQMNFLHCFTIDSGCRWFKVSA